MATWGIGDNHDSDEVQALKEKLRSKDAQITTLESQLVRREGDIKDLKSTYNEIADKLRREADRSLELETILKKRTEELQNERITHQNTELALISCQRNLKAAEQTTHEMQAIVDTLSTSANSSSAEMAGFQKENSALQVRVRDLQAEIAAKEQMEHSLSRHNQTGSSSSNKMQGRRRSSSCSALRVATLEREAVELRARSSRQATELGEARNRLSRAQDALVQFENEKVALEKRLQKQLEEVQSQLEERQDELRAFKEQGGENAAAREQSLLERLEDEEQRVIVLEKELAHTHGSRKRELTLLQRELERAMAQLEDEGRKAQDAETRSMKLVSEKQEALDERDQAKRAVQHLQEEIVSAKSKIRELEDQLKVSCTQSLPLPPSPPSPDSQTAAATERLLNAVNRLRDERNQLRRDLEFLSAENKFAVEDLKAKLSAALAGPPVPATDEDAAMQIDEEAPDVSQGQVKQDGRAAMVFALVVQHIEAERGDNVVQINRLLQDLFDARAKLAEAQKHLDEKEARVHEIQTMLHGGDDHMREAQQRMDDAVQKLHAADSQISVLKGTIERLQEETTREHGSHEETRSALAQAEARLSDITQALTDAEAFRDSLALQLQHREQDLEAVRAELAEADERYGQQLCAMSSGEQTRALRAQIETLEQRVLRRTEQIGVHQHDIKRLETNLRLQEERVAEMTAELEVMLGEKESMVEDCKTTRDERNEALNKCELFEEKVERLEEERDGLTLAVSSATENGIRLADEIQVLLARQAERDALQVELQSRLGEAEADKARIVEQATRLGVEHNHAVQLLEEKSCLLETSQQDAIRASGDVVQATVAIAMIYVEWRVAKLACGDAEAARLMAHKELDALQRELDYKLADISALQQQLDSSRLHRAEVEASTEAQFSIEKAALESELQTLQHANVELQSIHSHDMERLAQVSAELHCRLADRASRTETEDELRSELTRLRGESSNEVEELRSRLKQVHADLQDAQRRHEEAMLSYNEAQDALIHAKGELEIQLAEANAQLQASSHAEEELARLRSEQDAELQTLRDELLHATDNADEATKFYGQLKDEHQRVSEELQTVTTSAEEKAQRCEQLEVQLTEEKANHAHQLEALQNRLDHIAAELRGMEEARTELDVRYQQLMQESSSTQDELQSKLTSTLEEMDFLKATLQGEMELHTRDQRKHELELQAANEKRTNVEETQGMLVEELSALRARLDDTESSLQNLQDENTNLQFEVTNLEAELQRSKSLQRFLESEAKDSESLIKSLKDELEQAQGNYAQSEKACKAAEAAMSMREIQHEQALAALRRDLSALRANPKLEEKVAELEERNVEMEELLKNKCLEIEENDDRFIDMLKEKKKLTSKIESLTRKVHNLQSKLISNEANSAEVATSASAARLAPPITASDSASDSTHTVRPVPSTSSLPARTPTAPNARSRVTSGPSTQQRPRTPEARKSLQPVFRARSPEPKRERVPTQTAPVPVPVPSSSTSKKRRAPDDFEDCESLPPQGFTCESLPSAEPATPRARRALPTVRTGFTPLRGHVIPPNSAQLSPTRRTTTGAPLPDVTNSPRGQTHADTGKTAKRGWLGKIRNVPTQAPKDGSSRQPR